jgi:hypothetical protein
VSFLLQEGRKISPAPTIEMLCAEKNITRFG